MTYVKNIFAKMQKEQMEALELILSEILLLARDIQW